MGIEDWYSNLGAYQNHPEGLQKNTDNQAPRPHFPGWRPLSLHGGGDGDQGWGLKSSTLKALPSCLSVHYISATYVLWIIAFKTFNNFC